MAIFNTVMENISDVVTENVSDTSELDIAMESYGYTANEAMVTENEVADDICREFAEHAYKLEASTYMVDIALETAAMNGEDVESVMENALKSILDRAKKGIMAAWNSLQTFITNMKNKFRAFSTAKSSFVKKHKKKIEENAEKFKSGDNAFRFSGYEYPNPSVKFGKDIIAAAQNAAKDYSTHVETTPDLQVVFAKIAKDGGLKSEVRDIPTLGAAITNEFRGRKIEEETLDEAKVNVSDWINNVENAKSTFDAISAQEAIAKQAVNTILKDIKDLEKFSKKQDDGKDIAAYLHTGVKYNNMVMSVITKVTSVLVNNYGAMFKQQSRCLSTLYSKKEPKAKKKEKVDESFSFFDKVYDLA